MTPLAMMMMPQYTAAPPSAAAKQRGGIQIDDVYSERLLRATTAPRLTSSLTPETTPPP